MHEFVGDLATGLTLTAELDPGPLHAEAHMHAFHAGNGIDESRLQVRSRIKRAQLVYRTFSSCPQCCFYAGTERMHNPMRNNVPELGLESLLARTVRIPLSQYRSLPKR